MELWVSVPRDAVTRFAATEIAEPLLEPPGSAAFTCGFYIDN